MDFFKGMASALQPHATAKHGGERFCDIKKDLLMRLVSAEVAGAVFDYYEDSGKILSPYLFYEGVRLMGSYGPIAGMVKTRSMLKESAPEMDHEAYCGALADYNRYMKAASEKADGKADPADSSRLYDELWVRTAVMHYSQALDEVAMANDSFMPGSLFPSGWGGMMLLSGQWFDCVRVMRDRMSESGMGIDFSGVAMPVGSKSRIEREISLYGPPPQPSKKKDSAMSEKRGMEAALALGTY